MVDEYDRTTCERCCSRGSKGLAGFTMSLRNVHKRQCYTRILLHLHARPSIISSTNPCYEYLTNTTGEIVYHSTRNRVSKIRTQMSFTQICVYGLVNAVVSSIPRALVVTTFPYLRARCCYGTITPAQWLVPTMQ
jgi:hypothetical protein